MATVNFPEIKGESVIDPKDYTDIYSALIVDPKAIRENISKKEHIDVLAKIAANIVEIGPRPDRVQAKLQSRSSVKPEIAQKITTAITEVTNFIKKHSIRATQFQAAFPDLILKCRIKLLKANAVLQRFVPDDVLPLVFQFPGSGPILPIEYRNSDNYGAFNVALTKALSQGQQDVNWTIVNKTLEWSVDISDIEYESVLESDSNKDMSKGFTSSSLSSTTTPSSTTIVKKEEKKEKKTKGK